jgi:hypothetical protein
MFASTRLSRSDWLTNPAKPELSTAMPQLVQNSKEYSQNHTKIIET